MKHKTNHPIPNVNPADAKNERGSILKPLLLVLALLAVSASLTYAMVVTKASVAANAAAAAKAAATPTTGVPMGEFQFLVNDSSRSHSEKWEMSITGDVDGSVRTVKMKGFGKQQTEAFNLPHTQNYAITMKHLGSKLTTADCDWDAQVKWKKGVFSSSGWQPNYPVLSADAQKPQMVVTASGGLWMLVNDDNDEGLLGTAISGEAHSPNRATNTAWLKRLELKHECVATTPVNRSRTTIGVGEEVMLELVGVSSSGITWSASSGSLDQTNGNSVTFTAPIGTQKNKAKVRVSFPGGSLDVSFTVVPPTGFYALKPSAWNPAGVGVNHSYSGMDIQVIMTPRNVSFYRVSMMEVPTHYNKNVKGYYLNTTYFPNGPPNHDTQHLAGKTVNIRMNNFIGYGDEVYMGSPVTKYKPWAKGTFTWPIPAQWWIVGDPAVMNYPLPWSDQVFEITASGTATVKKFGHTATRNTNNIYTTLK